MKFLILMGMTSAGKSSVGKSLSKKLSLPFFDTDIELHKKTKLSPREFYTLYGEDAFRQSEYSVLKKILLCKKFASLVIVACGGGIADNKNAIEFLNKLKDKNNVKIFFLDVGEKTLFSRICRKAENEKTFPIFLGGNILKKEAEIKFNNIFQRRVKIYKNTADIIIRAENIEIEKIVENIIGLI